MSEDQISRLSTQLDELSGHVKGLKESVDGIDNRLADGAESFEQIRRAFPKDKDGQPDFRGHRDYHEQIISDKQFRREVMKDVAKKGAFIFTLFLFGLLWIGFEVKIKALFGVSPTDAAVHKP